MPLHVTLDLPDEVLTALKTSPEKFVHEMRIAAAVKWYELGMVSQGRGAEIAGLNRSRFMEACSRLSISPFQTSPSELEKEFMRE
ncbi:MAG: hypothetical protein UZ16_OP3001001061 [Candidatus Hinthialibacteria bacterium OLB16]|nr:MAG: hypothetical protein UZ16_OP3001001061 [Candidatus Hinthialibacteria bacterium OLB16]